jgi:hypothetical protein
MGCNGGDGVLGEVAGGFLNHFVFFGYKVVHF